MKLEDQIKALAQESGKNSMPNTMKERPMLFSGEMVKAILAGTKTQTRRIVKPQPETVEYWLHGKPSDKFNGICSLRDSSGSGWTISCGKFKPLYGMPAHQEIIGGPIIPAAHIWVRETFYPSPNDSPTFCGYYRATDPGRKVKWKPSIFMPRAASRITLEITGIRVERLNEISEEDAEAEGAPWICVPLKEEGEVPIGITQHGHKMGYHKIWTKINGLESWDANPYVWVITFKRIKP